MDIVKIITELGTNGALLVMVYLILRYFMKTTEQTNDLIKNHIDHNTESLRRLSEVVERSTAVLERLENKLQ